MEEALRALLTSSAAVTELVPAARIAWDSAPQGAGFPLIVLRVVSGFDEAHMQGPNGMTQARIQADCYALTPAAARAVSRAVRDCLHFYRGGDLLGVFHAGTRSGREGGSNEAERPFYVGLDFTLTWREANG
jgi:hypothetical protein